MKNAILAFVLILWSTVPVRAAIIISEVYPAGSGNTSYKADWFELTNTGSSAVDITGWKMDDNSNSFASSVPFSGTVTSIAAGQSVVFAEVATTTTEAAVVAAFKQAWFGSNVPAGFTMSTYSGLQVGLSSAGDAVNIYDAGGTLIANVSFGATTVGKTFDNAAGASGAISQQSAVGVNGAFTSFDGLEIGSPGTIGNTAAVPEPSSLALIAFALSGAGFSFRRRLQAAKTPAAV